MNGSKFAATFVLAGLCLQSTAVATDIYQIDVYVGGTPAFTDCLIFGNDGRIRFTRNTVVLAWVYDPSAPFGSGFTATTAGGDQVDTTVRLAIHGLFYEDRIVGGNAINGFGVTYHFTGVPNPGCGHDEPDSAAGPGGFDAVAAAGERPLEREYAAPSARSAPHRQEHEWPYAAVVTPPYDCFGFDCGLPQRRAGSGADTGTAYPAGVTSLREGATKSLAGQSFRVMLKPDGSASGVIDECWHFALDGRLANAAGVGLVWGTDMLDAASRAQEPDATSFQAVGRTGTAHGLAFHGRLVGSGELEIAGIRWFGDAISGYRGYAYLVRSC